LASSALSLGLTVATLAEPLTKHFHNTTPAGTVLLAVGAGKALTVLPSAV
jgi:hypothetical protein